MSTRLEISDLGAALEYGLVKIDTDDHYATSVPGVYAAGDVVTGESLRVKAMAGGREAAQRVYEYIMKRDPEHVSLYDYYYTRQTSGRCHRDMLAGKEETLPLT